MVGSIGTETTRIALGHVIVSVCSPASAVVLSRRSHLGVEGREGGGPLMGLGFRFRFVASKPYIFTLQSR